MASEQSSAVSSDSGNEEFKDVSEHSVRCLDMCNTYRHCVCKLNVCAIVVFAANENGIS